MQGIKMVSVKGLKGILSRLEFLEIVVFNIFSW